MRVTSIYDQTSVANTLLDTGTLVYPTPADSTFGTPDALIAVYEPSGAVTAANISIIDNDFGVNAIQIVAMPADALSHNFVIGFNSMNTPASRSLSAGLAYVPKSCKIQVAAAGATVTVHLKVYAVYYR